MKIAVVGASGELGRRVISRLMRNGHTDLVLTSRQPDLLAEYRDMENPPEIRGLDLTQVGASVNGLKDCDRIVLTPILTLSAPVAMALRQADCRAGLILLSSNNAGLDFSSEVYARIRACELDVSALDGEWAIVRPTMTYGTPDDGNIGRLTLLAMKRRFLPMAGSGKALHQPVHYEDLARLLVGLIERPSLPHIKVSACGQEVYTLRGMYEKIVEVSGSQAIILQPPVWSLKLLTGLLGRVGPISKDQLRRAELDRVPTWPAPAGWAPEQTLATGVAEIAGMIRAAKAGKPGG